MMLLGCTVAGACGGSTQRTKIEEVPIDNTPTTVSSGMPPDELNTTKTSSSSVVPSGSGTAAPGVGPQSLDARKNEDAGAPPPPLKFIKRPHGLTEHQCNEVVLHFAKLMQKEHHTPAPKASELLAHPVYGQMVIDCGQSTTHKQLRCGMTARSSTGWKKCME
jgi:hypothetical protein